MTEDALSHHEWIEVGKRRWCIRCDCFQQKHRIGMKFWKAPIDSEDCVRGLIAFAEGREKSAA